MYSKCLRVLSLVIVLGLPAAALHQVIASEPGSMPEPGDIPGITTADMFPSGCVDCHLNFIDRNMDTRISTQLAKWMEKAEPELIAKAQAASPEGVTLAGKHPSAAQSLADIPSACLECHNRMPREAPDFAQMVHLVHLTGGQENHYITLFQGACTHCHKLNSNTGKWFVPSGMEK